LRVGVLDCGLGNIASVMNMLRRIGADALQIDDYRASVKRIDKLIIPGVGNYGAYLAALRRRKLDVTIEEMVNSERSVLGICVGFQILGCQSSEAAGTGLNYFAKKCELLTPDRNLKVPNTGWGTIQTSGEMNLVKNGEKFYFNHSYAFTDTDKDLNSAFISGTSIIASLERDNVYGVQFHPEKSHVYGMALFKRFLDQ
jgi:glutamine amidotransferase